MRVATTLTGVTACALGFAPAATATAQAATTPAHTADPEVKILHLGPTGNAVHPRIPSYVAHQAVATAYDATAPAEPYSLGVGWSRGITEFQVCGYHPGNVWRCTPRYTGFDQADSYTRLDVGGNYRSWNRGLIKVYWNGGGPGNWDECNTNGDYIGPIQHLNLGSGQSFYGPVLTVGSGHPEC